MAPDRADFGYLQNRRMSRGLACFWVCGSMRSAHSISFKRGFVTFRKARKALVRGQSREKRNVWKSLVWNVFKVREVAGVVVDFCAILR